MELRGRLAAVEAESERRRSEAATQKAKAQNLAGQVCLLSQTTTGADCVFGLSSTWLITGDGDRSLCGCGPLLDSLTPGMDHTRRYDFLCRRRSWLRGARSWTRCSGSRGRRATPRSPRSESSPSAPPRRTPCGAPRAASATISAHSCTRIQAASLQQIDRDYAANTDHFARSTSGRSTPRLPRLPHHARALSGWCRQTTRCKCGACHGCIRKSSLAQASAMLMARRAELAQDRASRPASDGASAQQLAAAHRAEVAAAVAAADRARTDVEQLRDALAPRDAELQRLQVHAPIYRGPQRR